MKNVYNYVYLLCKKAVEKSWQNIKVIKGEFLRTARSVLSIRDFIPKTKELLECMKQQSSKRTTTGTSLRKITLAHLENFQHFSISS